LDIQVSNVISEASYPDCGLSWFSSDPPMQMMAQYFKINHGSYLPHPSPFIIHSHPAIQHHTNYAAENASLNKARHTNSRLFTWRSKGPKKPGDADGFPTDVND
jgi:hypothetical protein